MADDGEKLSGPVYEMFWDCPYCNTPKLLGKTHRHCPHCGANQDSERRYFPAEGEEVAVADHVFFGVDLLCASCATANSANSEFCRSCGGPLSEAAKAKLVLDKPAEPMNSAALQLTAKERPAKKSKFWLAAKAVVLLLIGAVTFNLLFKRQVELVVLGHQWQRVIGIDVYGPLRSSSWCDQMPARAYSVSRKSEVRDQRQIPDGQSCTSSRVDNGDGTFSTTQSCSTKYRSENIYADKCYYVVDTWTEKRQEVLSASDLSPLWPTPRISECAVVANGCQSLGRRKEEYQVNFLIDGKEQDNCLFKQNEWASFVVGQSYPGKVGGLTGNLDCKSIIKAMGQT